MKKPVTKSDMRDALQKETERFLKQGGSVDEIPQGTSGKDPQDPPLFLNRRLFLEPKASRTPVPEVVAAIEARRKERFRAKPKHKPRQPRPKRKTIYDDFGEPLRTVWLEE